MEHWITVHWVRHKWEKFVRTQRSDKTGISRAELTQVEPQNFTGEANVQHLIDTMRKRLCYCSSKETREYAEDLKIAIQNIEPEISDVLVPNCVYRCGCPEMDTKCKQWLSFVTWGTKVYSEDVRYMSIQERYNAYNEWFYRNRSMQQARWLP